MEYNYPKFTPEMKKTHTILIPNKIGRASCRERV